MLIAAMLAQYGGDGSADGGSAGYWALVVLIVVAVAATGTWVMRRVGRGKHH